MFCIFRDLDYFDYKEPPSDQPTPPELRSYPSLPHFDINCLTLFPARSPTHHVSPSQYFSFLTTASSLPTPLPAQLHHSVQHDPLIMYVTGESMGFDPFRRPVCLELATHAAWLVARPRRA